MIPRITIALLVISAITPPILARTWTDRTGQLTVEAEFVAAGPGKIWLRREDGETFEIDLADLSRADREYVARLVRRRDAEIAVDRSDAPKRIAYGPSRRLGELANPRIRESSGLACSRRHPGFFWTHNDSGDDARLYLFDAKGRDRGFCELDDVMAYDWEDLASFQSDGKFYLLACDVGNNGRGAAVQMLHLVEEPDFDPATGLGEKHVSRVRTIYYSYKDDHRDCEAVAVDPTDKTILFVTKERALTCFVYALPWPEPIENENAAEKTAQPTNETARTARPIGTLKIPLVTAMDVSPDGRRAIVATYLDAYEFVRDKDEDWEQAFSRLPRRVSLPRRAQGESICYGPDGKTLYLTSEKRPTPFWEIPLSSPTAARTSSLD